MKKHFHGRIRGLRLQDVVHSVLGLLPQVGFVVVRSIDSTVAVQSLERILDVHGIPFRERNGNILLVREALSFALEKRLFTGFDELWFFDTAPRRDLRDLPLVTSDSEDFSVSVPSQIAAAADESGCVLVAADGDGLNYLTPHSVIVQLLHGDGGTGAESRLTIKTD